MCSVSSPCFSCKIRQIVGFDSFICRYSRMVRFKDPEGAIHHFDFPESNIAFWITIKIEQTV